MTSNDHLSTSFSHPRQVTKNGQERQHRDQLFSQRRTTTTKSSSSTTASEAQSIQKSLMRTQMLLKNELDRVSYVATAIEEDGNVLKDTMDHHKSLNTKNAQKALTALQRAQQQEQRILMLSVGFFCMVAFYVLWSRVLLQFSFVYHLIGQLITFVSNGTMKVATLLSSGD